MALDGSFDGFYSVYITGTGGNGIIVLVLRDGLIAGADPFGVCFDGRYKLTDKGCSAAIAVHAPPDGFLVQGVSTGPSGVNYELTTHLPIDFLEKEYISISTPLGPVNAKFKWLRGFSDG